VLWRQLSAGEQVLHAVTVIGRIGAEIGKRCASLERSDRFELLGWWSRAWNARLRIPEDNNLPPRNYDALCAAFLSFAAWPAPLTPRPAPPAPYRRCSAAGNPHLYAGPGPAATPPCSWPPRRATATPGRQARSTKCRSPALHRRVSTSRRWGRRRACR
jgi:hypothetical protein